MKSLGQSGVKVGLVAALFVAAWAGPGAAAQQDEFKLESGQWEQVASPDPQSPEGQLQSVRKLLAQGEAKEAFDAVTRWLEAHGDHPMRVEALLLRGDAKVAQEDYYSALYDYESLIRSYPASDQYHTALEREYKIAQLFANGVKRKLWGMRILSAVGEAEEIFIRIQERAPGSALGERASMALGDLYYRQGEMTSAMDAYDLFLINYPRSEQAQRASLRLIQAALGTFKGPHFDPTGLIEASQRLETFQQRYPAEAQRIGVEALRTRIEASLALKLLYQANWYETRGNYVSAIYSYRRVLNDYPQTLAARQAVGELERLGQPIEIPGGEDPAAEAAAEGEGQAPRTITVETPEDAPQPEVEPDSSIRDISADPEPGR